MTGAELRACHDGQRLAIVQWLLRADLTHGCADGAAWRANLAVLLEPKHTTHHVVISCATPGWQALDVEEQPHPVHDHMHGAASLAVERLPPGRLLFEADTMPRETSARIRSASHNSGVLPLSMCCSLSMSRRFRRQAKMSSRFHELPAPRRSPRCWRFGSSQAVAQSDDADPEMRIQQLENQLRQLTGQNEELQYRNRQLEERLRRSGRRAGRARLASPPVAQPSVAAAPPPQPNPAAIASHSRATRSRRL